MFQEMHIQTDVLVMCLVNPRIDDAVCRAHQLCGDCITKISRVHVAHQCLPFNHVVSRRFVRHLVEDCLVVDLESVLSGIKHRTELQKDQQTGSQIRRASSARVGQSGLALHTSGPQSSARKFGKGRSKWTGSPYKWVDRPSGSAGGRSKWTGSPYKWASKFGEQVRRGGGRSE